ncbi:sensor domain-containing diguanylate cyclase [Dehalobacter sp. DCM]|uniref:sensor domain-containing diguanylate cyclase n=1 Tax=Dehalobacter sp. DCM TaxID=2907827 RepID=UPI0030817282|nr:sensor domain-containing diguanylate cyclase [Dehalobacter sp. DCM]
MELKYYKIIVESSPNMIWKSGIDGNCNYFNNTWLEFTGRTIEQELGDGWAEGVHKDDLKNCLKVYLDSFHNRQPFEMEYRLLRADGEYRWINDRGVPFFEEGEFSGYIGSCIDVNEKVEGRHLKFKAQRDGLTEITNREYFEKMFLQEFKKAKKMKSPLSIIMIDIDNFKSVNDTYGHLAGDKVLIALAKTIQKEIRNIDLFGRYGGEEFIIALPEIEGSSAKSIAERLRKKIEKTKISYKKQALRVTASFGAAQLSDEKNPKELLDKSDQAMYLSKGNGKNRVTLFE